MSFYAKLMGESEDRLASIARNLEAILNAKSGYSSAVEVFGLGRYDGHFASKPCVDSLAAEMLSVVRAFEPRLLEPQLTLVGREAGLWVRFVLSGTVGQVQVSFVLLFHSVFRNVRVVQP